MIINYSGPTTCPRTGTTTHWFDVKVVSLKWTTITVGLNENGKFTSGSKTFFELDKDQQDKIIAQVEAMHKRMF